MARKRRDEGGADGTAGPATAERNGTHPEPVALSPSPPPASTGGPVNAPAKAITVPVGDGSRIEGSIWPREVTQGGKAMTVYTATVRKTYRGEDEEWRHTTAFKGSELPVVQYVLGCCAEWILAQRREEDPPF